MSDFLNSLLGTPAPQTQAVDPSQYLQNAQLQANAPLSSVDPSESPPGAEDGWAARHSGVAGVARDIFGTLGDFLLTRMHMPAMYAPSQVNHAENYAYQGFDPKDPNGQGSLDAINRVRGVDFKTGNALANTVADNTRLTATANANQDYHKQMEDIKQAAVDDNTRRNVSNALNSLIDTRTGKPYPNAAETFEKLKPQLTRYMTVRKLDPKAEGFPDTFDPDTIGATVNQFNPVNRQDNFKETVAHHIAAEATAQQNADSGTSKASSYADSVVNNNINQKTRIATTVSEGGLNRGSREGIAAAHDAAHQTGIVTQQTGAMARRLLPKVGSIVQGKVPGETIEIIKH